jgi:hypothetical protein
MFKIIVCLFLLFAVFSCSTTIDQKSNPINTVYVSTTGNDNNSGTNTSEPLLTIDKAIQKANVTVYVESGVYTNNFGLGSTSIVINKKIHVSGGWNAGFTSQTGISVLNGFNNISRILVISNNYVTVDGVAVMNSIGGGIWVYGNLCTLDIASSNNTGYGITIAGDSNTITAFVSNNNGGGIDTEGSYNTINAVIDKNTGYGIYMAGSCNYFTGTSRNNTTHGCVCWAGKSNSIVSASIINNGSRGVVLSYSTFYSKIISCIITNNSGTTGVIELEGVGQSNGVLISNNLIGGKTGADYGIYEMSSADQTGHQLIGNIFITNRLGFLYYDHTSGNALLTEIDTKINSIWSGASVGTGNIVTNL